MKQVVCATFRLVSVVKRLADERNGLSEEENSVSAEKNGPCVAFGKMTGQKDRVSNDRGEMLATLSEMSAKQNSIHICLAIAQPGFKTQSVATGGKLEGGVNVGK